MQVLKSDIRGRILDAAGVIFAQKGFMKATMRDVAAASGICVGNIYNYFKDKDDLLCELLRPVTSVIGNLPFSHDDRPAWNAEDLRSGAFLKDIAEDFASLSDSHAGLLDILFSKSQGPSLENCREDFMVKFVSAARKRLSDMSIGSLAQPLGVSDEMLRLQAMSLYDLFEMIFRCHDPQERNVIIGEYLNYSEAGWRALAGE